LADHSHWKRKLVLSIVENNTVTVRGATLVGKESNRVKNT